MEDFEADLDTLRVRRAALEEQLKNGGPDARSLQDQLRNIDAQIVVLEEAIANADASRDACPAPRSCVSSGPARRFLPRGSPTTS